MTNKTCKIRKLLISEILEFRDCTFKIENGKKFLRKLFPDKNKTIRTKVLNKRIN